MKLPVTFRDSESTVLIDVDPGVYNRAIGGSEYFQGVILDLTRRQISDGEITIAWDEIAVGAPGSVPTSGWASGPPSPSAP